jgi:hypothetical protein
MDPFSQGLKINFIWSFSSQKIILIVHGFLQMIEYEWLKQLSILKHFCSNLFTIFYKLKISFYILVARI